MADILEQLDGFLREQRGKVATEEEQEWRQRLEAKLDQLTAAEPAKSRREVLEELAADDRLLAELEAELASEADELDDDDDDGQEEGDEEEGDEEEEQTSGIRWQRVPLDVPRIYSGEDEPEHVEYIDEDGKVKVRAGRKRGQPVSEEWHELDEPTDDDDEEGEENDE